MNFYLALAAALAVYTSIGEAVYCSAISSGDSCIVETGCVWLPFTNPPRCGFMDKCEDNCAACTENDCKVGSGGNCLYNTNTNTCFGSICDTDCQNCFSPHECADSFAPGGCVMEHSESCIPREPIVIVEPEIYEYPSCIPDCLQNRGGCPNNEPCHQLLDSVYRIEATGNCYLALTTCWGCLRDDTVVGVGTHLANVTCPFAPTAEPTPEPTSRPTTFEHYALPLMAQLVSGDTLNSFGWDGLSNVDKSTFNAFFAETCLVRRECPNCAEGHRVIYYKRIANDCDTFDAYDMLTHRWMSVDENGIGNVLNEDFLLTTNEAVARDINIQSWEQCDGKCWYKCNYVDDHDLVLGGFKECGPFIASSHNFYCESGPLCKSVRWSVL